eukprot:TRINITY_DN1646_c0_g1_i2.p2 TRINITY_DN1646_c0_g1~~TRINITY_DN1646_c0_g1_i2.p2  ORF type:complete len:115 (+),score=21.20 TRINITY_DN1646_c0_g1_i2:191-535(+)
MLVGMCERDLGVPPGKAWADAVEKIRFRTPYMPWGDGSVAQTEAECQKLWKQRKKMRPDQKAKGSSAEGCGVGMPVLRVVLTGCLGVATVCLSCLLYTSPSPRDRTRSRMPSSA